MSKVSLASLEAFMRYATPRLEYLAYPMTKEAYAKGAAQLATLFARFAAKNPKAYTTLVEAASVGKNFKKDSAVLKAFAALRDFERTGGGIDHKLLDAVSDATKGKHAANDIIHTLVGDANDPNIQRVLSILKNTGLPNPISAVDDAAKSVVDDVAKAVKPSNAGTASAKAVKPGSEGAGIPPSGSPPVDIADGAPPSRLMNNVADSAARAAHRGSSILNWYHEHPIAAAASIAAGGAGVGGTVGGLVGHSSGRSSGLQDGIQQGTTEALRWHLMQTAAARQRYAAQQNSFWNRLMNVFAPTDVDSVLPMSLPNTPSLDKVASSRNAGITKQAGKLKSLIDLVRKSKIYQTSANTIPGQYTKHALGSLIWGKHGVGSMIRGLGRRLGANGVYDVNTGAWTYVDPGNVTGVLNKLRNALAKGGQRMIEQGERASKPWKSRLEALEQGGHKVQANLLRYGAPVAGLATVYGPSMVLDEDNPLTWPMKPIRWGLEYGNPIGLAATGVMALGDTYTSMKQEAERAALDAAESAAKQTIEESAKALAQQGIMSYLGGAFSPETFAKTFYNQGMERTDEIMKTLRMMQNNGEDLSKLLKSGQPT